MTCKQATGVILAGGAGKRMQRKNKAFIKLGEKPIIEWLLESLFNVFENVLVVTNTPELFEHLPVKTTRDKIIRSRRNTLAGIHAGLGEINTQYGFFVACDMPFISTLLIREMLKFCDGYDVIIPCYKNYLEPTFAIYSQNCLSPIEKNLLKDEYKITKFFPEVKVKYLSEEFCYKHDPGFYSFFNINTPEELQKAREIINS